MKSSKWLGVIAVGVLLSSCNALIGSFVQPIKLENNPIGLDKAKLATDALEIIPTDVQAGGSKTVNFNDIDPGDTRGLAPNTIEGSLTFDKVIVSGTCATPLADLPTTFQIQLKGVKVNVQDSETNKVSSTASPDPLVVNVNDAAPERSVASVTYDLPANTTLGITFGRQLFNIVTQAPTSNQATLSGQVIINNNAFAGCTLEVEIGDHTVTLKNFS